MYTKTCICLFLTFLSIESKIIRNNEMIARYQRGQRHSGDETETEDKSEKILLTMQNVLCRNFPKIPCNLITQDETLRKLISQSIQQMNFKTISWENKQEPVVNSEELSNFLRVKHTGFFTKDVESKHSKRKETKKSFKDDLKSYNGRKKVKKFYPHKTKESKKAFVSDKASMSEEFADIVSPHKTTGPVWHIDYTKQGEPSFSNKYKMDKGRGYGVGRRNKEVFIKKSFVRSGVDDE